MAYTAPPYATTSNPYLQTGVVKAPTQWDPDLTVVPDKKLYFLASDKALFKLPRFPNIQNEWQRQSDQKCHKNMTDPETIRWCGSNLLDETQLLCPENDCVCVRRTAAKIASQQWPPAVGAAFQAAVDARCPPPPGLFSFGKKKA